MLSSTSACLFVAQQLRGTQGSALPIQVAPRGAADDVAASTLNLSQPLYSESRSRQKQHAAAQQQQQNLRPSQQSGQQHLLPSQHITHQPQHPTPVFPQSGFSTPQHGKSVDVSSTVSPQSLDLQLPSINQVDGVVAGADGGNLTAPKIQRAVLSYGKVRCAWRFR